MMKNITSPSESILPKEIKGAMDSTDKANLTTSYAN